jgi:DNA-binding response OmpR family regulator
VRVLVVSQDPLVRLRATSALARDDHEVIERDSGEQARHELRTGETVADVIVIDGDLQPRGGFAVLYDLHEQAQLSGESVPPSIVLISREADRFLVDWSRADAWLLKPVDPFVLARTVAELAGTAAPGAGQAVPS